MPPVDYPALLKVARDLLVAIGEDPMREGLIETPRRFAKAWQEFIDYDPGHTDTAFESVKANQMVIVKGIRVWSMCEHHLLPFWCDVTIGYITDEHVLGLSKFARIAQQKAHSLQLQERLVEEIALEIKTLAQTESVMVIAKGEHLCMTMRGAKTPAQMISSSVHGDFLNEPQTRAEFLSLLGV